MAISGIPIMDPRNAPIVGVDVSLPAVPLTSLEPSALRKRFLRLPEWVPELASEPRLSSREPTHASVLLPIVLRSQPTVLLTQRTMHLSTHSGQIAFPGGKADQGDKDAAATALREAYEEVGLASDFIEVLGSMPHYITGSSFIITPIVALVHPGFTLTPNPQEVDDVFEVPLAFLMNPANHRRHAYEPSPGLLREWFSMPYEDEAAQRFIWGATAGMLRNFYRLLSA